MVRMFHQHLKHIHQCWFFNNLGKHEYFWANYNISLTWTRPIWGWFPLLTMISSEGGQWGRYNLPRPMRFLTIWANKNIWQHRQTSSCNHAAPILESPQPRSTPATNWVAWRAPGGPGGPCGKWVSSHPINWVLPILWWNMTVNAWWELKVLGLVN